MRGKAAYRRRRETAHSPLRPYSTVELRFLEPPRETKVREIGNFEISGVKLQWKQVQGKQLLVREIGAFEKWRVREIEVPLSHVYTRAQIYFVIAREEWKSNLTGIRLSAGPSASVTLDLPQVDFFKRRKKQKSPKREKRTLRKSTVTPSVPAVVGYTLFNVYFQSSLQKQADKIKTFL